ncbi:hypothetical protein CHARACLAT_031832, partial [Characodon lateralis]|nr:hypothetical protein [Characodon lateralis]
MMRGLITFTVLFVAVLARETFEGHQVLRIVPKNEVQLSLLKNLEEMIEFELDIWKGVTGVSFPVDVRVPPHTLQFFKSYLESHDLEYSTMIEDIQAIVDVEREQMASSARFAQPRNTDSFDYGTYHTLAEIYSFQDMLVAENPNFVSKIVIGQSYEGRPLNVLK